MPLKKWNPETPDNETPEARNWHLFTENSKTIVRTDLSIQSPVGTPTINAAYFTLYGPLVFYTMDLTLNNNDGWTTSSFVYMPFTPTSDAGAAIRIYKTGQVLVSNTGAIITSTYFLTLNWMFFAGAYTNTTGADQLVTIQGWYHRN